MWLNLRPNLHEESAFTKLEVCWYLLVKMVLPWDWRRPRPERDMPDVTLAWRVTCLMSLLPGEWHAWCHSCLESDMPDVTLAWRVTCLMSLLPGEWHAWCHSCLDSDMRDVTLAWRVTCLMSLLAGEWHAWCHSCLERDMSDVTLAWRGAAHSLLNHIANKCYCKPYLGFLCSSEKSSLATLGIFWHSSTTKAVLGQLSLPCRSRCP